MSHTSSFPGLLVTCVLLLASCASVPAEPSVASSGPSLDLFKRLEGEWFVADENGSPTATVNNSYEVQRRRKCRSRTHLSRSAS